MKTFTDNTGRTWSIQVNVDAIKRVRDLVQVNLLEIVEGKLLERLTTDPILLCDCVYALVQPEALARSVSDQEFGRAMGGDTIEQATDALLEELIDFFPLGRRKVLKAALDKLNHLQATALEAVRTRLASPDLEKSLTEQLQRLGG